MENQIDNKGKAKVFENPILEFLARTTPTIALLTYIPIILGCFIYNFMTGAVTSWGMITIFFFTGVFSWTLFEYLMHRHIFHWVNDSPAVQKFHHYSHGLHHQFPRDEDHLFLPPIPGLMIAIIVFSLLWLFMEQYAYVFMPGFVTGYLIYSFIHYFMHTAKPPSFMKFLWKHHSLHHYKYENKGYGVSSTIWDHVFGTMPPKQ